MSVGPMDPRQHYPRSMDSRPQTEPPFCSFHFANHQCARDTVPALPVSALRRYREMHNNKEA